MFHGKKNIYIYRSSMNYFEDMNVIHQYFKDNRSNLLTSSPRTDLFGPKLLFPMFK